MQLLQKNTLNEQLSVPGTGVNVLLTIKSFILSLKAMSQSAILCTGASGAMCTSNLVSQSACYLRVAIL